MKQTIVFADDEQGIRRFCKRELEAAGYRVLLAKNGDDVIDVVETFAVDLVVLDVHMVPCNGLLAADRVKRINARLPVILHTADPDYEGFVSPLVEAVVRKSETLEVLKTAIRDLISPLASDGLEVACALPLSGLSPMMFPFGVTD